MALVTQQLLTKIGVKVDLQSIDWGTLVSRRAGKKAPAEGGWNLFMTSWIFGDLYSPAVNQAAEGSCERAWFGWYCSEAMEQLRAEWAGSEDAAQRHAYDEVPYVPLGQWTRRRAYRTHVKGAVPFAAPVLWNVWLDEK